MGDVPGLAVDAETSRTVVSRRFGPFMKCLRLGSGMSQEEVDAASGVGRHTIGDIENRKTHATIESGKRLAHAFKLKLWMLLLLAEDDEAAGADAFPQQKILPEEVQDMLRALLLREMAALGVEVARQNSSSEK